MQGILGFKEHSAVDELNALLIYRILKGRRRFYVSDLLIWNHSQSVRLGGRDMVETSKMSILLMSRIIQIEAQ